MIGMRRDGLTPLTGEDKGDLYRVDLKSGGGVKLTFVRSLHFFTDYDQAGHHGNFAAGSGAYVSPTGELILYNVPHDDQDGFNPDIVRFAEIRHRDVNREGSPLREPTVDAGGPYFVDEGGSLELSGIGAQAANQPWVELYDDHDFNDRSIVIDFKDRNLLELNDLHHLDGFDNADHDDGKASSVRWRAPVGVNIEMFGGANFTATKVILFGTGQTEECSDLEDNHVDTGRIEFVGKDDGDDLEFGDSCSSLRFVGTPGGGLLEFDWDLDNDGFFGEQAADAPNGEELGATPTFQAGALDGPATYDVSLRVLDAFGIVGIAPTTITVFNAPPTAAVNGDTFGVPGMPRGFSLSATDPSAADTLAGFTFAVDFGDGNSTGVNTGGLLAVSHTYLAEGTYTVTATATDKDAETSAPATHSIEIKAAGVLPDPTDPTKTALFVGGTTGDDTIRVIQQGTSGNYEVTINGRSKGVFAPTGRIIIFAQGGNDSVNVPNSLPLPVEMYGGDGNDTMNGGAGADLIVGQAGNDQLGGGAGRDILIGGSGLDRLDGHADDDVLIGSATIHDGNFAALHAIQAEWLRTDANASIRSSHLLDGTGLNGPAAKLDAASIIDDGVADFLSGASGENFLRQ
jgi:PKD repeat protein